MKQLLLIAGLLLGSTLSFAQSFDMDAYDWEKTPMTYIPTDEDKKFPTVVIREHTFIEYKINKKDELERYRVYHSLKLINDDKSVEENNKISLRTGEGSDLVSIKSRVIKDGKVVSEVGNKDLKNITEEGSTLKRLAIKGLVKGAMLETIIKLRIQPDLYDDEFVQTDVPIKVSTFTLVTPDHLKFITKSYNGLNKLRDTTMDERLYSILEQKDVPAFQEEKYSLERANLMRIEYTYDENLSSNKKYQKYPEMGRLVFDGIFSNYEENQKALEKFLKSLKMDKMSEDEKIYAIENYIKTKISLKEEVETERAISKILSQKYASAYGFDLLFIQSLSLANIPFELVITCEKGYKRFDPDFDSWTYLKDFILYFPNSGKYLEPENLLSRYGIISDDYLDQYGLFVKSVKIGDIISGVASVKKIALNDGRTSTDDLFMTATLNKDLNNASFDYKRQFMSYADQGYYRSIYFLSNDNEVRKELLDAIITNGVKEIKPGAPKVENSDLNSYDQFTKPFTLSCNFSTNHYIEEAGDQVLFKIGELIGPQTEMYQEKPRQNPIDFGTAHAYKRVLKVVVPEGYVMKGLDKLNINYAYNGPDGKPAFGFTSTYTLTGQTLEVVCNEYYYQSALPVDMYQQFTKVINAAADFNKISILIEKE